MKKSTRVISYLLIFAVVFTFGWESASFYIAKKNGDTQSAKNTSAIAALSSLITNQNSEQLADLSLFLTIWLDGKTRISQGPLITRFNLVFLSFTRTRIFFGEGS